VIDHLYRRRRLILVAAVFVFALAGAFGGPVAGLLNSEDDFDDPGAQAVITRATLAHEGGASPTPDLVALVRYGDTDGRDRIAKAAAGLRDPGVASVLEPTGPGMVSRDGHSAYLLATFRDGVRRGPVAERIQKRLSTVPGVVVGGPAIAQKQVGDQVSADLARAEMLAFPLLFLLSLIVFRGLVAALLPLVIGFTTIVVTFALIRIVNVVEPMSIFALNLIIGMGLGLAIDYSLFVVSRFREELARHGDETLPALRATMRTAGRTVAFSAVTVAAALAALLVFPQRFLFSMGVGGLLVALVSAGVALTLLPALLAVLGTRVNALSPKRLRRGLEREASADRGGPWYRLSQAVMRRPGTVAVSTAALLVVLGLPFLRIEFTGVDPSVLPQERSARVVHDALLTEFPPNRTSPVLVAVDGPAGAAPAVRAYADRLAALPGAAPVAPEVTRVGDLWRVEVVGHGTALSSEGKAFARAVRDQRPPFPALVGGSAAEQVDHQASLRDHLPWAVAILATTTLVILFLMTGSVVLPVKALLMNLLTLSAAFGTLVLVFQDGRFESLLGYTSQGALESSQPILLFAIAFGLSTDYGVFLLTRIKEARDAGASDSDAVALGLERTGRIVSYAALLFVIAIGAFATSKVIFIKEVGIGTAVAVLVDATIVRALLVPALMALLGRWNWWAPRPLVRLHRRIGLREAAA
jgi:RND superfamily putative drug exporter